MRALRGLVASIVVASVPCTAPAETIHYTAPAREALSKYRYVFLGKVLDSHGPGEWTVKPTRVWKGSWSGDQKRFRVKNRQGMDD
jgi:hypothetical protein